MKDLRPRALFVCAIIMSSAFAQSGVKALTDADDRSKEKWSRTSSAQKGIAPVDTSRIYRINDVEVMPQFPGGEAAMYEYITGSFQFPDSAGTKSIGGKIYVEFVVERTGAVDKVVVRRGPDQVLNAEAVRVINSMPHWIPGKYFGGQIVACRMVIPIVCDPK